MTEESGGTSNLSGCPIVCLSTRLSEPSMTKQRSVPSVGYQNVTTEHKMGVCVWHKEVVVGNELKALPKEQKCIVLSFQREKQQK